MVFTFPWGTGIPSSFPFWWLTSTANVPTTTLPMLSVFTPPASCAHSWTYEAEAFNGVSGGLFVQNLLGGLSDTSCFPPGYTNGGRGSITIAFSPGACPSGYSSPAVISAGGVTTAYCCPESFFYTSFLSSSGYANSTLGTVEYMGCISTYSGGATTVSARSAVDIGSNGLNLTVISDPVTMWAQPIEVQYQQSDLSRYTITATSNSTVSTSSSPSPAATGAVGSASATPGSASSSGQSSSSTQAPDSLSSSSHSLSTGAKAGLAVGVTVLGLLIIALLALLAMWLRRRKRREQQQRQNPVELYAPVTRPEELDDVPSSKPGFAAPEELDGTPRYVYPLEKPLHNGAHPALQGGTKHPYAKI